MPQGWKAFRRCRARRSQTRHPSSVVAGDERGGTCVGRPVRVGTRGSLRRPARPRATAPAAPGRVRSRDGAVFSSFAFSMDDGAVEPRGMSAQAAEFGDPEPRFERQAVSVCGHVVLPLALNGRADQEEGIDLGRVRNVTIRLLAPFGWRGQRCRPKSSTATQSGVVRSGVRRREQPCKRPSTGHLRTVQQNAHVPSRLRVSCGSFARR